MTGTALGNLEVKSPDLKSCVIDGTSYAVPDYVEKFLNQRKEGEPVEYSFTEGEKGRRLTKIMRVNRTEKPAQVKEPAKVPPPQLHHVRVIKVNEIALKYFNLSKDPKVAGERLFMMTPAMFGKFTDAGIKEGDEIDILIDAQGIVSLPQLSKDVHLQGNLDRMNGPADGETVSPPGGEIIKAPPQEPEKATAAPQEEKKPQAEPKTSAPSTSQPAVDVGMCTLVIGGTINLKNFENLKVEVSGPAGYRREMIEYLKDTLDLLGKKEPTTGGMIDAWKNRVLGGVGE